MMFLLTCDKKLTKSQLSHTHASTKRKITDELKHNAGWYEVREGSPVEVQWAVIVIVVVVIVTSHAAHSSGCGGDLFAKVGCPFPSSPLFLSPLNSPSGAPTLNPARNLGAVGTGDSAVSSPQRVRAEHDRQTFFAFGAF